jgi:hypothetical protein
MTNSFRLLVVPFLLACAAALPAWAEEKPKTRTLFDGKTLKNWKVTDFAGHGEVKVEDGKLILLYGETLTGVTWAGAALPRENYEIHLQAMRVDGNDFFCGLTFPVGKDPCSFILGGWGGGVIGLSSLDGYDASENETTQYQEFKSGRWHDVRLRVTPAAIRVWLDKKKIIDVDRAKRKISIRPEVELSKPLGIASWQTTAAIRDLTLRPLSPQEIKAAQTSRP